MTRIKQVKKPFVYLCPAAALSIIEKTQHRGNKEHAELEPCMRKAGRYRDKDVRQKERKSEGCPLCPGLIPVYIDEQAAKHIHKCPVADTGEQTEQYNTDYFKHFSDFYTFPKPDCGNTEKE